MEPDNKLEMIDCSKSDISITIKENEKEKHTLKEIETTTLSNKQNQSNHNIKPHNSLSKREYRVLYLSKIEKTKKKRNYPNNQVITSKYTIITFLPMTLLLQFKRYANIYFLITMIIQCIPLISPLNPITAVAPFIIVIAISVFREGLEDWNRHKEDAKENSHKVLKYNYINKKYENCMSKDLEVGDVILLNNNSIIPADCVLLFCKNISKISYVMTSNLDGEKNLKPRYCHPDLFRIFNQSQDHFCMRGKLKYNLPNPDLTKFDGNLFINNEKNMIKLDAKHIIYKGTMLANTKFAIALVVYTGSQTKIVMNSQKCPPKESHLEKLVNILIIVIFCIQFFLCIICSILNSFWFKNNCDKTKNYLELKDWMKNKFFSAFISFWTFLLLLNTMIPISLIVTIEIVKYSQAFLMNWDIEMYSKIKERFAQCNSCSLNEELGQIKYIFSDKTGTLTSNKLEFTACAIGNEFFGMSEEELENKDGKTLSKRKERLNKEKVVEKILDKAIPIIYTFPDKELKEYSTGNKKGETLNIQLKSLNGKCEYNLENTQSVINMFLYCLSLNHTCFVEKTPKPGVKINEPKLIRSNTKRDDIATFGNQLKEKLDSVMSLNLVENYDKFNISYSGENPDEIILVDTAKRLGFVFLGGDDTLTHLRINSEINGNVVNGRNEKWEILKIIKFTSARGKMSIIVKFNDTIFLFCKGGNSKVGKILGENQPFLNNINNKSIKLSEMGLRVLWIGMKILDEEEYYLWKGEYDEIPNDDIKAQDELLLKIEQGLTLIGCTAVEDNLQDNVPDTIKDLQTAGINIWVLTGDNLPTAKNITISCKLITPGMELYEIYEDVEKYKKFVSKLVSNNNNSNNYITMNGKNDNTSKSLENNINTNIFNEEKIEQSILEIESFEKKYPSSYENDKTILRTKAIYLIGLSQMYSFYKSSEEKRKDILRGILIESSILTLILPNQKNLELKYYLHPLTKQFLNLALDSEAVICCRVSPMQKALIVRMIKKNIKGAITLAIGDGANDVSMIQEADVGIGIYGEEGTQAALSSDYAIGEFQFLRKLLLFHGRLNYMRISDMIIYFFFKNFLFTLPQFFFAFYSGYSGQTIFDDWYVSLFNLVFTSLPLLFKALLDQDISERDGQFIKEHISYCYYNGRESINFNLKIFTINLIESCIFSLIVFFFTEYIIQIPLNSTGDLSDHWICSNTQFTAVILIVNYRILLNIKYHTWINWIIIFATSYVLYFLFFYVSSLFSFFKSMNVAKVIFKYPNFYLILFLTVHIEFIFDLFYYSFHLNFIDNPVNLLRKYINDKSLNNEKNEEIIDRKIKEFDVRMREVFKVQRISEQYLSNH